MMCVVISIIIISTILIQRFVDCVCICHLRKARPPIRLLAFPPIHSRPIDSLPIWAIVCQYGQYTLHQLTLSPYGWHLSFLLPCRFLKRVALFEHIWVAPVCDLLLACPYTSLSLGLVPCVARLTPTDGCLEPCQEGLCRAPMNLCRAAYMGHMGGGHRSRMGM